MSSGNLTADRRFTYAAMLRRDGDFEAAADVLRQTLEVAPDWAEARFTLAEVLAEGGRKYDAVAAFEHYLEVDPADSMGAAGRIAVLSERAPETLSAAYITRLFDQYAPRFEKALRENLKYKAPELLRAAVDAVKPEGTFARVFDLGCGTGLAGAAFKERAVWLGGADLSAAMIKGAEAKAIYDQLVVGDMIAALKETERCDLILAADVLTYLGDLAPTFAAVRGKLDGLFAFTVQRCEEGFSLGEEQRFSHSRAYIETAAVEAGFKVLTLEDASSRQEAGKDVPGLVAVMT